MFRHEALSILTRRWCGWLFTVVNIRVFYQHRRQVGLMFAQHSHLRLQNETEWITWHRHVHRWLSIRPDFDFLFEFITWQLSCPPTRLAQHTSWGCWGRFVDWTTLWLAIWTTIDMRKHFSFTFARSTRDTRDMNLFTLIKFTEIEKFYDQSSKCWMM